MGITHSSYGPFAPGDFCHDFARPDLLATKYIAHLSPHMSPMQSQKTSDRPPGPSDSNRNSFLMSTSVIINSLDQLVQVLRIIRLVSYITKPSQAHLRDTGHLYTASDKRNSLTYSIEGANSKIPLVEFLISAAENKSYCTSHRCHHRYFSILTESHNTDDNGRIWMNFLNADA